MVGQFFLAWDSLVDLPMGPVFEYMVTACVMFYGDKKLARLHGEKVVLSFWRVLGIVNV